MGGFLFSRDGTKVICTKHTNLAETNTGTGLRVARRAMLGLVGLLLAWTWMHPAYAQTRAHILLQDSPLAGFQYHAGKALWPQMRVGDALDLVREPDNLHDARAVRVEWQGRKIGYVPRRENADVARFMDGGQILVARISRLAAVRDPWSRVRLEILIPVQQPGQAAR